MKFMWLRFALLNFLNRYWPPEEPTAAELLERINELEAELQKYRERTYVWIDPNVRTRGYEQSAWNSEPEKRTDPSLDTHKTALEDLIGTKTLPTIPGEFARKYTRKLREQAQSDGFLL